MCELFEKPSQLLNFGIPENIVIEEVTRISRLPFALAIPPSVLVSPLSLVPCPLSLLPCPFSIPCPRYPLPKYPNLSPPPNPAAARTSRTTARRPRRSSSGRFSSSSSCVFSLFNISPPLKSWVVIVVFFGIRWFFFVAKRFAPETRDATDATDMSVLSSHSSQKYYFFSAFSAFISFIFSVYRTEYFHCHISFVQTLIRPNEVKKQAVFFRHRKDYTVPSEVKNMTLMTTNKTTHSWLPNVMQFFLFVL